MDVELARTFLEIMQSGTFAKASERLHVTQTTVTARIHSLEQQLNCRLFIRNRRGARLTKEGERFAHYAQQMISVWQAAQDACQTPLENAKETLWLGCENSLWNPIMVDWLAALESCERFQLSAQVATTETLYDDLRRKRLDAAVVHSARYYPELQIEQVAEEKLVHVAATHCTSPNLYIDWGEEFAQQFDRCLPFSRQTADYYSLGPLALKVMLRQGGNGYFRTRVVQHHLERGALSLVEQSPEFHYPIYLVSRTDTPQSQRSLVTEQLQQVLQESTHWLV
ncbi:LysR family transcriptional regulator [Marinomonas ostreistagni]|uniref:LysR family transcriptional regulator n=1 Tax=Marinomonas ostreistagni TaxID=359209 RepID=UPI00194E684E|nr:LysR family transcriptional regulator [Marinomonas ostreistagni]MBM6550851.1 LysR family transcriptional regulator [Marinomonas ostreistagni]